MNCNIKDFGAIVSDRLQTEAIQKAIDQCFAEGGGEVIIPCGVFRTASIRLRSNVTLHLMSGAILEGSDCCDDYFDFANDSLEPARPEDLTRDEGVNPYGKWHHGIIHVLNAHNVSIIGEEGSYIDGCNCYDPNGEEGYRGPHGIVIFNSKNITLKGYTVRNCANWAHNIFESREIKIDQLTIYGGHDGIDIRSCDDVTIENCNIYNGDDSIAGFDNINVVIKNCLFNAACAAMRFGGTNVLVDNCRSFGPAAFGHRYRLADEKKAVGAYSDESCNHKLQNLFLYYCDYRANIRQTPGNITIQNCEFDDQQRMFKMFFGEDQCWCCNRALTQIKFKNCKITNLHGPMIIRGDEKEQFVLEIEDVEIHGAEEREREELILAENFTQINMKNVKISGFGKNKIVVSGKRGEINLENSDAVTVIEE